MKPPGDIYGSGPFPCLLRSSSFFSTPEFHVASPCKQSCFHCSFFPPCFTPTRYKEESWKRSRCAGLDASHTVCIYGSNFSLASISPVAHLDLPCCASRRSTFWHSWRALP